MKFLIEERLPRHSLNSVKKYHNRSASGSKRGLTIARQLKLLCLGGIGLLGILVLLPGQISAQQSEDGEVRGAWITNIDSEVMYSRQNIAEGMAFLKEHGFNVVFPVVWNKGFTLHPSEVMEDYFGEAYRQDSLFREKKLDPLKEIIIEAHRHGMEVIPWFEFGFASSYNNNGGHILDAYPEWAARDSAGALLKKNNFEWMNAFHPEVQEFITSINMEVVANYDIDGIQGDDRLPALPAKAGYSDFTKNLYKQETGNPVPENPHDSTFIAWKAGKLNQFGDELYNKVKKVDSSLIVSFAPSVYPWSLDNYLQDSPSWVQNGSVDLLIPQVYRWDISSYKSTLDQTLEVHEVPGRKDVTLVPGIIIKAGDKYNGADYVTEALDYNRQKQVPGEVYFFYEGLDEKNEHLADTLHKYFYGDDVKLPYRPADAPERRPGGILVDEHQADTVTIAGDHPLKTKQYSAAVNGDYVTTAHPLEFRLAISHQGIYDIYIHHPKRPEMKAPVTAIKTGEAVEILNQDKVTSQSHSGWQKVATIRYQPSGKDKMEMVTLRTSAADASTHYAADAVMALPNRKASR